MKLNLFLLLFSLLFTHSSYAFKFSPMSQTIGTKQSDSNALFYLENDSDHPIAVTVTLTQREITSTGLEINNKVGNEISVYPSQLIIPANEKRSVKVSWTGSQNPLHELAYRLISEQLPIDLEKIKSKKASIKVLLRYVAALYVKGDDFSSDIAIGEIKTQKDQVIIEVLNRGKKHQVLSNVNLKFIDDKIKKEIFFKSDELKGMSGENILAGSNRFFSFPNSGKFTDIKAIDKVKINFDKD